MKKCLALLLAMMMCFALVSCGGEVTDMEVNGENTTVSDFLITTLREYMESDGYLARKQVFEDSFGCAAKDLTVTKVIEIVAGDLGENQISVHFLAVKADCDYGTENGFFANILLVVDYETGEVYDEFTLDQDWFNMNGTKEQQIAYMLNGPLVGDGYKGGTIIVKSEERTTLSKKDIAVINEAISCVDESTDLDENESTQAGMASETTTAETTTAETTTAVTTETTIPLTLENWQEYFELGAYVSGVNYNGFGEFESLRTNFSFFLKADIADKVTKIENLVFEVALRDGYFTWYEYNLETGELLQKQAASADEVPSYHQVSDYQGVRTPATNVKAYGAFVRTMMFKLSESVSGDRYTFIGDAFRTMEITRIQGTITIAE